MPNRITKTINGRRIQFVKHSQGEYDQVGLTRKDFKQRKTRAIPFSEGFFHVKKR
jgi:hypothetical protein